ncbi:MAG TPA: isocitrate lyase/phosphoenolpyruvate mutase family protein [Streptosporangiaceae bacterium]|nr:isocitrate lyase/phosphoenolpyruvate mutase family protein [Streptosporangiaceae bacterium]
MSPSLAERFLALHRPGAPLLMPNPWDVGSARALASLGFAALATTSSGFAATLGRLDGSVTRDEAVAHAGQIAAAVSPVPLSADLENGFADAPADVAATVAAAVRAGLAGCSIEDSTKDPGNPIYDPGLAADRIAAAAQAAGGQLILTGRAENFLHGRPDLADTIARLNRYADAGADVLFASGLRRADDIKAVVESVGRPVNVLLPAAGPSVSELADLGVSRISVGGTFAAVAFGALAQAARELQGPAPYGFWDGAAAGRGLIRAAFTGPGTVTP